MGVEYTLLVTSYVRKFEGFTDTLLDSFPVNEVGDAVGSGFPKIALDLDENVLLVATTGSYPNFVMKFFRLSGFSTTVLDSFETSIETNTSAHGLTFDGSDLIMGGDTVSDTREVWKFDGFSSTIVDSFDWSSVSSYALKGLTWDGNLVGLSDKLYKLSGFSATVLDSADASTSYCGLSNDRELYYYISHDSSIATWKRPFSGGAVASISERGSGVEVEPRLPSAWIYVYHGATPTGERVSKVRFKAADDSEIDLTNPVKIPQSGSHYSFWKHIALVAIKAPENFINNVKFYVESPIDWPGCVLRCGLVDNYAQATGVQGVTGDEASTYHPDHPTMDDVNNYTSSNPLSIPGSIGNTTGKVTDGYLLLQLEVTPSAQPGITPEGNLIIEYDEA